MLKLLLVLIFLFVLINESKGMNILLCSIVFPWVFGPYSAQLSMIGKALLEEGHTVYWFGASYNLKADRTYTLEQALDVVEGIAHPSEEREPFAKSLIYLGNSKGGGSKWYVSDVNRHVRKYKIDALMSLCDVDRLRADGEFIAKTSIAWYPNHFVDLGLDTEKLSSYSHIASLAPSDAMMIQNTLPKKKVVWVPHAMQIPKKILNADKYALRKKFGVPKGKFVVLVNCGNYDTINRKSLDTSVFAFKELLKTHPNAFLYLRALSVYDIQKFEYPSSNSPMAELNIQMLLSLARLPEGSFIWNPRMDTYRRVLEMTKMADVLLHPSKAEGFGMPILEAQAIGVPVITTAFGAMKDYTLNGYSVEPAQPHFMVKGICAYPNMTGVVEALRRVADGEIPAENRTNTMEWISKEMSEEAVTQKLVGMLKSNYYKRLGDGNENDDDDNDNRSNNNKKKGKKSKKGKLVNVTESVVRIGTDVEFIDSKEMNAKNAIFSQFIYERGDVYIDYLEAGSDSDFYEEYFTKEWILIRSEDYEITDHEELEFAINRYGDEYDAIIVRITAPDGSMFPRDEDLLSGRIDPRMSLAVKTNEFIEHLEDKVGDKALFEAVLDHIRGRNIKIFDCDAFEYIGQF